MKTALRVERAVSSGSEHLSADQLVALFGQLFFKRFNTCLEGGGEEPIYLPADNKYSYHRLVFRHDYVSSGLHEIAHWCLVSEQRRQLQDFGFWYHPDGRTESQQRAFEQVEIKPQALEWIFSVAANHQFHISVDNLSAGIDTSDEFQEKVANQARYWCAFNSLPDCANKLIDALSQRFDTEPLNQSHYQDSLMD